MVGDRVDRLNRKCCVWSGKDEGVVGDEQGLGRRSTNVQGVMQSHGRWSEAIGRRAKDHPRQGCWDKEGERRGGKRSGEEWGGKNEEQTRETGRGASYIFLMLMSHVWRTGSLQALLHTRNVSAEEAAMYYFNKLENEVPSCPEEGDDDLIFKMVFVVNMDLSMGVGKVATQVGHAAVGLYQVLQEKNSWREMAWKWDHTGSKKVVMQGSNTAHLLELQALAMSLSLPTYLVQDAGQTQVGSHCIQQQGLAVSQLYGGLILPGRDLRSHSDRRLFARPRQGELA
ncbi:hypothetical protein Z043_105608 [Scleropages formosus]|uniref:peptidyl-tRNA hydrolase n=1 Tax=Scleropages formosus TaxID=113540 RepID=A0A0P7V2D8_SCLFO|nr:hypothetical protein Z043_105608 [Scleropages formosus]